MKILMPQPDEMTGRPMNDPPPIPFPVRAVYIRMSNETMPSKQSEAVRRHWEASRRAMVQPDTEDMDDESWGNLTAEPRAVDYVETEAAGLPAMWITPKQSVADRVLLCIHGGGFLGGSIYTHRKLFGHLAKATGARALVFDYRLAPAHNHPTQVDDATDVYRWLLDQGIRSDHVAFTGDSAGGGLTITTQLRARERGLPLPAATMPFSPWVDMEAADESYDTNRDRDPFFLREAVRQFAGMFLGPDGDPRDPLASPVHADLRGLGPIYIQAGGDETLVGDARQLAAHARANGVEVRIDVFPGMLHTFQMAAGRAPEADDAIRRMAAWLRPKLGL
jgi:acetyl esterase/lipase